MIGYRSLVLTITLLFLSPGILAATDRGEYLETLIHGDASDIEAALESGASPHRFFRQRYADQFPEPWRAYGYVGPTPVMVAILYNDVEVVETLLEAGADVEAEMTYGQTPLDLAAMVGGFQKVELLLAHGASVDDSREALSAAAESDAMDVFEELLEQDPGQDQLDRDLFRIAGEVDLAYIRRLLELGAAPNRAIPTKSEPYGFRWAFLDAVKGGSIEEIQLFLDFDADVSQRRNTVHQGVRVERTDGLTPLMVAARSRSPEIVQLLLEAGANPSARINPGSFFPWSCRSAAGFAESNEALQGTAVMLRLIEGAYIPDEQWPECGVGLEPQRSESN